MRKLTLDVKVRRARWDPVPAEPPSLLRRSLIADIVHHVTLQARPPEVMLLFGDGWVDQAGLGDTRPPEAEELLAGTLIAAARRDGVRRVFRIGALRIRDGGGQPRSAACLLELLPGPDAGATPRWWFAHAPVETIHQGSGAVGDPWTEAEGAGAAALPGGARHWLATTPEQIASIEIGTTPAPAPEPVVRASVHELTADLPADARGVAELAGAMVHADLRAGNLGGMLVLAFHRRDVERWEIRGELPCSIDDLVRAIAAYASAEAVALVRPAVMELGEGEGEGEDEQRHPTITALAERDGHRFVHARTLEITPDGVTDAGLVMLTDAGEPGADGWIGVAPTQPIQVHAQGQTPGPGGAVPEA